MPIIDLHNHTTASDGSLSPSEIIHKAAAKGIDFFAVTDHDTVKGLQEASDTAKQYPNLTFIPGIEITSDHKFLTDSPAECHILGLNIDPTSPALLNLIQDLVDRRFNRNPKILEKVNQLFKLSNPITENEIRATNNKSDDFAYGRPHIAAVMMKRGLVSSIQEAFDFYLGADGSCNVEVASPSPQRAIETILAAGGVPCLAHAVTLNLSPEKLCEAIKELKSLGLAAIEVAHPMFSAEDAELMNLIAEKFELKKSAGTDYHAETRSAFAEKATYFENVDWLTRN